MADPRNAWTIEDVAARFEEAASTGRRLPPVRVQGHFNCWPAIVRSEWETFAADERVAYSNCSARSQATPRREAPRYWRSDWRARACCRPVSTRAVT